MGLFIQTAFFLRKHLLWNPTRLKCDVQQIPLNALKIPSGVFAFCQMTLSQHVATLSSFSKLLFLLTRKSSILEKFSRMARRREPKQSAGPPRLDLGVSSLFQVAASDNL